MDRTCSRCGIANPGAAQFCAQCGHPLDAGPSTVGRAAHPNPLPIPDGYQPCESAADLHYRTESAWGGTRLLGTESLGLVLFNGGYPLQAVTLRVEGRDPAGEVLFAAKSIVERIPRGKATKVEVPSYEIPEPAETLTVTLVSAEYQVEDR